MLFSCYGASGTFRSASDFDFFRGVFDKTRHLWWEIGGELINKKKVSASWLTKKLKDWWAAKFVLQLRIVLDYQYDPPETPVSFSVSLHRWVFMLVRSAFCWLGELLILQHSFVLVNYILFRILHWYPFPQAKNRKQFWLGPKSQALCEKAWGSPCLWSWFVGRFCPRLCLQAPISDWAVQTQRWAFKDMITDWWFEMIL